MAAVGGICGRTGPSRGNEAAQPCRGHGEVRIVRGKGVGRFACVETPAFVASFDYVAMVVEPVEKRRRHLGIAENGRPITDAQVGGDDDLGLLIEPAHHIKEQLPAVHREGRLAELVQDDEVGALQMVGDTARRAGPGLGLEAVHEIDCFVEAGPDAGADALAAYGNGEMGLAGARPADQKDIALGLRKDAGAEVVDQALVDGRAGEIEVRQFLGSGSLAMVI